ncbi:unnamed protein product, partial [Nesidiocoris tenuis]
SGAYKAVDNGKPRKIWRSTRRQIRKIHRAALGPASCHWSSDRRWGPRLEAAADPKRRRRAKTPLHRSPSLCRPRIDLRDGGGGLPTSPGCWPQSFGNIPQRLRALRNTAAYLSSASNSGSLAQLPFEFGRQPPNIDPVVRYTSRPPIRAAASDTSRRFPHVPPFVPDDIARTNRPM